MIRVCLDLNIFVGAVLAHKHGRSTTAAQSLVDAVRTGSCVRGPIALVISWGMILRLQAVLLRLTGDMALAEQLSTAIAAYAQQGPSLTLGGVGVIPMDDVEDLHVLETALAGRADILVTHNLEDFVVGDVQPLVAPRFYGIRRGRQKLLIAHTYAGAAWLQGVDLPREAADFLDP